ncbi:hypothetical protein BZA70DRAFT_275512 [Myxozyma melibiosi]|uniref:F-box domain-containing protein n=1 Tax=Myxozyma melibiosi TaxID=54550 RepID=A0ABR1F884_9ASCO
MAPECGVARYSPITITHLPAELIERIALFLSHADFNAFRLSLPPLAGVDLNDEAFLRTKMIYEFGLEGYQYASALKADPDPQLQRVASSWDMIYGGMEEQWKIPFGDMKGWGATGFDGTPLEPAYAYPHIRLIPAHHVLDFGIVPVHVFRNIRVAPGNYLLQYRLCIKERPLEKYADFDNLEFNVYLYRSDFKNDRNSPTDPINPTRDLISSTIFGARTACEIARGTKDVELAEFYVPPGRYSGYEWRTLMIEIRETDRLSRFKSGLNLEYVHLKRSEQGSDRLKTVRVVPQKLGPRLSWKLRPENIKSTSTSSSLLQWGAEKVAIALREKLNDFPESSKFFE